MLCSCQQDYKKAFKEGRYDDGCSPVERSSCRGYPEMQIFPSSQMLQNQNQVLPWSHRRLPAQILRMPSQCPNWTAWSRTHRRMALQDQLAVRSGSVRLLQTCFVRTTWLPSHPPFLEIVRSDAHEQLMDPGSNQKAISSRKQLEWEPELRMQTPCCH